MLGEERPLQRRNRPEDLLACMVTELALQGGNNATSKQRRMIQERLYCITRISASLGIEAGSGHSVKEGLLDEGQKGVNHKPYCIKDY